MPAASPSLARQADALVAAGRIGEAYGLLTGPAAAADADALMCLAIWRLAGRFVRRDLAAAHDLFRRAAELGHRDAAAVHAAFLAHGAAGARDWPAALARLATLSEFDAAARDELALIDSMRLSAEGDPLALPCEERLSARPSVSRFPALFSPAECDFLIGRARPALSPSVIIDPQTGRHVRNPIRTSDGMAFPFTNESPAVHALNRRIAAVTGTDPSQGEPLQILRYTPGQEYKPHFDAVAGDPNQRILTVLVYLNDEYQGGETLFVRTGLRFRGRRGDALLFRNALPDGRADELSQHAGLPVVSGEKLIGSRWIRQRPFLLPPPPPLLDL